MAYQGKLADNFVYVKQSGLYVPAPLAAASGIATLDGTGKLASAQTPAGVTLAGYKDSVRAASTGNLTLSGTQTIDGVACIAGDRVLVKNQTTGANNGIYVVAAGAWSRATDMATSGQVTPMLLVTPSEGTAAGRIFQLSTTGTITLGTTALVFVLLGSQGGGLDYTIDFRTSARDYKAGTGTGSGSAGDNAQTVPFTITANNGTTTPSTLASGLTLTPVSSSNAGVLEATATNGLRAQITGGTAGKLTDFRFDMTQLGLDRSRSFSLWLLLNRSQYTVPTASEAGFALLGNFVTGTPKVTLYSEHATNNVALKSMVLGNVNGTYTAGQLSTTSDSSDDVKISVFLPTSCAFYTTPSVGSTFPSSIALNAFGRRGRATVDQLLMLPAADGLYIFPNDDDQLRLRVRADSTSVTMAYYALRVVQAAP